MTWTKYDVKGKYIKLIQNSFVILFGLILTLVLIEICFQILPVSDSTKTQDVNASDPYMRFEPTRDVYISIGKVFEIKAKKKTNKQGFFDDRDFNPKSTTKKVTLIGDSYLEALQVSNTEAIHGQLQLLLGSNWEVNGVGTSGSPLSQYVAYARYVRESLDPNVYVFVIVANDFDESLLRYKKSPGHHYYDDELQLVRIDYKIDPLKSFLRSFATARYFAINMKGYSVFRGRHLDIAEFTSNTLRTVDQEKIVWSKKAVEQFLIDVSRITIEKEVILLFDGNRNAIYTDKPDSHTFSELMKNYLIDKSKTQKNIRILDLQPIFEKSYITDGMRFEFEIDSHWNAHGHHVAARELGALINRSGL